MVKPHHVEIHAGALSDAATLIGAFAGNATFSEMSLTAYNSLVSDLGDIAGLIDERCANRGVPDASTDVEWEFLDELRRYALDVIEALTTGATRQE